MKTVFGKTSPVLFNIQQRSTLLCTDSRTTLFFHYKQHSVRYLDVAHVPARLLALVSQTEATAYISSTHFSINKRFYDILKMKITAIKALKTNWPHNSMAPASLFPFLLGRY